MEKNNRTKKSLDKNIKVKINNKASGITLIALVVTIIVLIILASISINLILGENGIIRKAQEARQETEIEQIKEEINLAWQEVVIEKHIKGINEEQQAEMLKNILAKKDPNVKVTLKKGIIEVTYKGYTTNISIDQNVVLEQSDIWKMAVVANTYVDDAGIYTVDANGDIYLLDNMNLQIQNIGNIVNIEMGGIVIISEDGKAYVTEDGTLVCINNEYDELKEEKIVNISDTGVIILENGKAYWDNASGTLECINDIYNELKEEKIINIEIASEGAYIILENGKAYWDNGSGTLECVNDIYDELKEEKIIDIDTTDETLSFVLENGKAYTVEDETLVCINDSYDDLKEEKIINIELISSGAYIILENGKVYGVGNGTLVCINDLFDELKEEKIIDINTSDETVSFVLENGKAYKTTDDGNLVSLNKGKIILKDKNIVAIAGNSSNTVAIDEQGKVYTWGNNWYGLLGNGQEANSNVPICISEIEGNALQGKKIVDIAVNNNNVVAIDENGKVYIWGNNSNGQLGNGTVESSNLPICISEIEGNVLQDKKIVDIVINSNNAVAIDNEGKVYTWGDNGNGQLGNGTTESSKLPICISEIEGNVLQGKRIVEIQMTDTYSEIVAKDEQGNAYTWGLYKYEPICVNEIEGSVLKGKKIVDIVIGERETVAIDEEGKVYTWGDNTAGQLGDGTNESSELPICISEIEGNVLQGKKIIDIKISKTVMNSNARIALIPLPHIVAIDEDGKVYTWGDNTNGELGDGTTQSSNLPICISEIEGNILQGKKAETSLVNNSCTIIIDNVGKIYVSGVIN